MISKENFDIISQSCWARECEKCRCVKGNDSGVCSYDVCPQFSYVYHEKQTPLTPNEFADRMAEIHKKHLIESDDEEACHIEMDNLIQCLLIDLGYEDGAYIFEHTSKWYA